MSGIQNQVWVTSAVSDDDVVKALVLCSSLRRVLTTRKIVVLAAPHLSNELRQTLWSAFDTVLYLDNSMKLTSLKLDDYAKLYAILALGLFDMGVYLSPTMMAIKNFDNIFDDKIVGIRLLPDETNTSMFVFEPSVSRYQALVNGLAVSKETNLGTFLQSWTKNQCRIPKFLNADIVTEFKNNEVHLNSQEDVNVVNLEKFYCENDFKNTKTDSFLENLIRTHWKRINSEDVLPLLSSATSNNYGSLIHFGCPERPFTQSFLAEPIAIVGMSCRFPASNNLEEFWELLLHAKDGTCNPPDFRWRREQTCRQAPGSRNTNAGFLKVPVDEFDAKFFGVSPKEAMFMDPQHRILHELVWEALEDACIDTNALRGTLGSVFVGSWMNDFKDLLVNSGNSEFYRLYMGNSIGACAARISFLLGLTGPSVATESGCSSAIVAVHMACKSLQKNESSLALACGVNMLLHPFEGDELPMVVSPDGHSKTFSEDANGFARAEGAGVLVLKRFSDAVRDGDRIWGMIRGSAMCQEGVSKSMGTPTVHCESLAMQTALKDANISPENVSYIEAHGTGTVVGDPMEIAAIAKAYHTPTRVEPLIIGSVKVNVGHTESCSGITGIIKVVLSMHHELIPAHRNFTKINPSIDLASVPAVIPIEKTKWKRKLGIYRIAGVSSFGITGTDAHVIIQEPIQQVERVNALSATDQILPDRSFHLLKLSAKTEEAMELLMEKYVQFSENSSDEITDICFSANIGRTDFNVRRALLVRDKNEIGQNIKAERYFKGNLDTSTGSKKLCFLFTGQGSQYSGMAKTLHESCPTFKIHFDFCQNIFRTNYNIDISKIIWSASNEIGRTLYSQPAIFAVEYALLKVWESWGVIPDYVLGHSLGEFAAAVCAKLLSVEDAINLVARRSILIDCLPKGKMLVIKEDKSHVANLLEKFSKCSDLFNIDYAAFNSTQQTVIAGDVKDIELFAKFLKENEVKCVELEASHAFHSRHMDPILDEYKQAASTILEQVKIRKSSCGYISGMQGVLLETEKTLNVEYWTQHTRFPVDFLNASKTAVELGCRIFVEIGPHPVLSTLAMMNNDVPLICLQSLKKLENNWQTMLSSLGQLYTSGIHINWTGVDKWRVRRKVRLPNYPFIGKKFWPDMLQVAGQSIHPLLGSSILNASSSKIFQSGVNLRTQTWIKHHMVGNFVIFPGAAFLEMSLAAGFWVLNGSTDAYAKPARAMKIENLNILAPLSIDESKITLLQTVVDFSICNEKSFDATNIKISHFQDNIKNGWLCHSEARFFHVLDKTEKSTAFNILDVKAIAESQGSEDDMVGKYYEKLSSVGLNFGSCFRSIGKIWKLNNTFVVKLQVCLEMEERNNQFIVHPVILDAMIQSLMLPTLVDSKKRKLQVPLKIGKFIWLSKISSLDLYVQVNVKPNTKSQPEITSNQCCATLLNAEGKVLARMEDVEFVDTTERAIKSVLEQHLNPMADLWEEVWEIGPKEPSLNLESLPLYITEEEKIQLERYSECPDHITTTLHEINTLVYLNMLKSLYHCGWKPNHEHDEFDEDKLFLDLKIQKPFRKQFEFFLKVFQDEGILIRSGKNIKICLDKMPSLKYIENELHKPKYSTNLVNKFRSTLLMIKMGQSLHEFLKGTQSVLGVLFPENKEEPSAGEFYLDYGRLLDFEPLVEQVDTLWFNRYKNLEQDSTGIIRILEIGAGTGGYTQACLRVVEKCGVKFEYTNTDISAAFFSSAEKRFEKWAKFMKFKRLNIEEDPLSQGFAPGFYDYICASDVIHATKSLKETLANVRMLLKPGGFFELLEQITVNRFITYLFGLLDGFWRFEDIDVRPDHCTVSKETWCSVLEQTGFEVVGVHPSVHELQGCIKSRRTFSEPMYKSPSLNKAWLILHEPANLVSEFLIEAMETLASNRNIFLATPGSEPFTKTTNNKFTLRRNNEEDFTKLIESINASKAHIEGVLYCWSLAKLQTKQIQYDTIQPYFILSKVIRMLKQCTQARFCALVNDSCPIEGNTLHGFSSYMFVGFTKSLQNENSDLWCKVIDIGNAKGKIENQMVFHEVWSPHKEIFVALKDQSRCVPKLCPLKPTDTALELPAGTNRFQLIMPETKSIKDLKFGYLDKLELGPKDIEIQVKASALNFKDIMNILKPTEFFKDMNAVGFDFAGMVKRVGSNVSKWLVGDRVFGVNIGNSALPSHIKLNENNVIRIPDTMTFCEASTLPAAGLTTYHCLMEIAKIQPTDIVLIHTATGGVGLYAIQACQNVGATIIATAGSTRKHNYLRSLGIKHIFHSRNTEYTRKILDITNGHGVDVVLNSLTGPGFIKATLDACAKNARFVEMSKLSIWTPDEIRQTRPDIEYTIVDLTSFYESSWQVLLQTLDSLVQSNVIHPIPFTKFDGVYIREALTYLQRAKHIGKVVCVLPEIKIDSGKTLIQHYTFSENATYLITGGLGGIGFEICQWMLQKGAKYIVLAGRNSPTDILKKKIATLNTKFEAKITSALLDVSDYNQLESLIKNEIPKMNYPTLRGIMHAAGTLNDGMIENHTWDTFYSTFPAKVQGTLNLHLLTENMFNIEYFVMFSSVAAMFGPPGQSNHASANCFEDALAHYRYTNGLPASTINWGQWGEVGVATEIIVPGVKPFSTRQGISAIEYALKYNRIQTGVVNIESVFLLRKLLPFVSTYFDKNVWKSSKNGMSSRNNNIVPDVFWQKYDTAETSEGKEIVLKQAAIQILRRVLKMDDADSIDENANFQEMGVDSLMFVELKNELQSLLGERVTVSAAVLKDCNTLNLLSSKLAKIIQGIHNHDATLPTNEEVEKLIQEDSVLPAHIKLKQDFVKTVDIKDVSCVLLTGVTGTLGPYVLKELSQLSQIKQIICLIRPTKAVPFKERLQNILTERQLLNDIDMSKVSCLSGNIAERRLGLKDSVWEHLCNNVDGIIHCAARVQHWERYSKTTEKDSARVVNVVSLKCLLELACTGKKLKHIYCASSMAAVATVNKSGTMSEEWPNPADYNGITTLAYPVSKFIGDLIMKTAIVERGIPGKVFRLPLLVGDSKTGRFILDHNHVMLRYLFILKTGVMPSNPMPTTMLPVDVCAEVTIKLFFNPNVRDDIYNICNIDPDPDQEFVEVAKKLGYQVETVEFSDFVRKVSDTTSDESPFAIFKEVYKNEDDLLSLYNTAPLLKHWIINSGTRDDFFVSKKIKKYLPEFYNDTESSMKCIYRDFLFAKSQGWLEKYTT